MPDESQSPEARRPILFEYVMQVYSTMEEQASVEKDEDTKRTSLVWEGFMTHLISDELGFPAPYYTKILRKMKEMDCIVQLRRGGSTTPSRWLLVQAPTEELFDEAQPSKMTQRQGRIAALEQQIRDLNRRVSQLEATSGEIVHRA
jgi:hypothetical protein